MSNTTDDQIGWKQIRAGVELIKWSKLAQWNELELCFVAASEDKFEFESGGWKQVHSEFGRLICWITFGVGSEYLAKGFCLVKEPNTNFAPPKSVLKVPSQDDDIKRWVQKVIEHRNSPNKNIFKQANTAFFESALTFGTLDRVLKRLEENLTPEEDRDFVIASFDLLRDSIRNRDAHQYTQNTRAFHFHAVEKLFVPAFNILLAKLDRDELRRGLSKSY